MTKSTRTHLEHPTLPPRPNQHQSEKHHDPSSTQTPTTNPKSKSLQRLSQPVTTLMHKFSPPPLEEESQKAAKILRKMCYEISSSPNTPPPQIPPTVINSCLALAIFTTTRASGLASLSHGSGILVARKAKEYGGGWSSPAGITVNSAGLGVMAGVDVYSCVLVINTLSALKKFERTRFSLGGDVGVVAGSLGGAWRGELGLGNGVNSYVRSKKGLYAGIQLDGTVITSRTDENARFYSERVSVERILEGGVGRWTVLQDTLSEIDGFSAAASLPLLIPMGERFDEEMRAGGGYGTLGGSKKKDVVVVKGQFPVIMEFDDRRGQTKGEDGIWRPRKEAQHQKKEVGQFPVIMEFDDRRGQTKGEDGIWRPRKQAQDQVQVQPLPQQQVQIQHQPRPTRLSKEEWKRGKIYSELFDPEKKEDLINTLPLNPQQQEQQEQQPLSPRPSQPLMSGALSISSKDDLYDVHEKEQIDVNTKISPLVVVKKEYVEPGTLGGFADLTYRSGFSERKGKKKDGKKEKKELVVENDDGDASEWEDERLFYDLNSRPEHYDSNPLLSGAGGKEEWEDERGFYVDVPKEKESGKDEGEWEDERGFYTIVQLEERGEGEVRKKEKKVKGDATRGARDSVYAKAERFA